MCKKKTEKLVLKTSLYTHTHTHTHTHLYTLSANMYVLCTYIMNDIQLVTFQSTECKRKFLLPAIHENILS